MRQAGYVTRRRFLAGLGALALGLYADKFNFPAYAGKCGVIPVVSKTHVEHEIEGYGGIDFPAIDTPAIAPSPGIIHSILSMDVDNHIVVINHGMNNYTVLGHIFPQPGLRKGQRVRRNQVVGRTYPTSDSHLQLTFMPPRWHAEQIKKNDPLSRLLGLDVDFYSADPQKFGLYECICPEQVAEADLRFFRTSAQAEQYVNARLNDMTKTSLLSQEERELIARSGISANYGNLRRFDRRLLLLEEKLSKDKGREAEQIRNQLRVYKNVKIRLSVPLPGFEEESREP